MCIYVQTLILFWIVFCCYLSFYVSKFFSRNTHRITSQDRFPKTLSHSYNCISFLVVFLFWCLSLFPIVWTGLPNSLVVKLFNKKKQYQLVFNFFLMVSLYFSRTFDTLRNHPSFYLFNHRGRVLFRSPEEESSSIHNQQALPNPIRLHKLEHLHWDWSLLPVTSCMSDKICFC